MNQQTPDPGGLRQALLDLLETQALEDERTLAELDRRAASGAPVYSTLLALIAHFQLPEPTARQHWRKIRVQREKLREQLGRDLGLRVAALDYFQNLSGELRNPKLVELAAFDELERSAFTDALTGLHNRAFFEQALRRELKRARRGARPLALLLLTVDDFDRLGHAAGDRVLAALGRLVRRTLREIDLAARFGGEVGLLLPETSRAGARVAAERLRQAVANDFGAQTPPVTISVGAVAAPEDGSEVEPLLAAAGRALQRARGEGGNRVALEPASAPATRRTSSSGG